MFAPPILACPEAESAWEGATNLWNYLDFTLIPFKENKYLCICRDGPTYLPECTTPNKL